MDYGGAVFQYIQLGQVPVYALIVFAVGMLFTTLGAAIPAYIAAKMPPIEAMRGEK
jgi:ABC-type antimicrobial peptide transport system permease subunit